MAHAPFSHRKAFILLLLYLSLGLIAWSQSPADDFIKKGRDFFGLFQYDKAKEQFIKAVAMDGNSAEAHFQLGMALRKLNKADDAIKSFERSLQIAPEEMDCQRALASIYIVYAKDAKTANDRPRMVNNLHKACMAYPQSTSIWASLLENWAADKKWDEIIKVADLIKKANKDALEVGDDEKLQTALVYVGKAFMELRDHGRAKEFIRLAGMIRRPNEMMLRLKNSLNEAAKRTAFTLMDEAKALLEEKKFKEAIEKLKLAQAADSNNTDVMDLIDKTTKDMSVADFLSLADESEKQGNFEEALEHVNKAILVDEVSQELRERAASITAHIEKIQEDKARKQAQQLARKQAGLEKKNKLSAILKAADENEKKRAYEAAAKNYQQALELDKDNAEFKAAVERNQKLGLEANDKQSKFSEALNSAQKAYESDDYDQAYALLKELAADGDCPPDKYLPQLIQCCARLARWDEVETFTEKLAALKPLIDEVTYFRGVIAYQKSDFSAAREPLSRIYGKNPNYSPELKNMMWRLWYEKYKWGLILAGFFFSFWLFKTGKEVLVKLGKAHLERTIERALANGNYEKVIPLLEERLSESGYVENRQKMTIALAEAYLKQKRYADAHQRGLEVVAKDSRNATASRILGETSFQLGDHTPDGIERIHNLYKLDESRKELLGYLTNHFRSQHADHKLALEIYSKQIGFFPDDQETLFYLADLYLKRQKFDANTLKVFERATKMNPDHPEYCQGLIKSLDATGKKEEAAKALEKGRERWPDHDSFRRREEPAQRERPRLKGPLTAGPAQASSPLPPLDEVSPPPPGAFGATPAPVDGGFTLPELGTDLPPLPPIAPPPPPPGEGVNCPSCGAANSVREYYCCTCGKPLR